jgi:hypothetical protein
VSQRRHSGQWNEEVDVHDWGGEPRGRGQPPGTHIKQATTMTRERKDVAEDDNFSRW